MTEGHVLLLAMELWSVEDLDGVPEGFDAGAGSVEKKDWVVKEARRMVEFVTQEYEKEEIQRVLRSEGDYSPVQSDEEEDGDGDNDGCKCGQSKSYNGSRKVSHSSIK